MNPLPDQQGTAGAAGILDTVLYGLDRSLRSLTRGRARLVSYFLVAQPVPEPVHRRDRKPSRMTVRRAEQEELRTLPFPRPESIIEHRLDQQAVCFVAFLDETLIGFLWLVPGEYREDEVRCRFRPVPEGRGAWDFDVYIAPEHRLGRAFARLWEAANAWLRAQGFRWTMSRISSFNAASIASHRRLGARFVGRAIFLRFGRTQLAWSSGGPLLHCSRTSEPLVRVRAPRD